MQGGNIGTKMVPTDTSYPLYSNQRSCFKQVGQEYGSKKNYSERPAMHGGLEQEKTVPDSRKDGSGREAENWQELVLNSFSVIA